MQRALQAWAHLRDAAKRFQLIDGGEWASAFAFNVVFSLLPLLVLFVTLASAVVDPADAARAIVKGPRGNN